MISIKNLEFRYGDSEDPALRDITLDVESGDFLGIIGPSGAGKSTLTYAMSGVIPHHYKGDFYGSVEIGGLDTVQSSPEAIARHVGSVFQDVEGQLLASVVEDEILFGLENFGIPREEIEERIEYALSSSGISDLRCRTIASLSGGQKQKVAIASITALRPEVIVLDEPTGELDPQSSRRVFETLRELNHTYGVTVVIVEQKIMMLCEFARRMAVMEAGRIILEGPVREVLSHGERLEEAGVNIPRVAALSRRLREAGLYRGNTPIDLAEAETMMREVAADAAF
ncbi:MAG: ATP-binding cassette domain-containing protein [Synergistaceae bacterium]|jgi:energy-coupling factor transport system ATP-binding protein|nr:ATP-binding cassette domain-containing protein [Synergistaceae bacterium]